MEKITVSQYAKIKGITPQAVYKQLNNQLKDFLIVENGKKYISTSALEENEELNQVDNHFKQPLNQVDNHFLISQIEEKDKTIQTLLEQINSLQLQNERLTQFANNSQYIMAMSNKKEFKKLLKAQNQENEQEKIEEKKGFFKIFKKKK